MDLFETTWRDVWSGQEQREPVGAIFTRPEIVDLILDLAGYAPEKARLAETRVLEPSCGDGAFVARLLYRLVLSEKLHGSALGWADPVLDRALCAADISPPSLSTAREAILDQLTAAACPEARAQSLASKWTIQTDFLLNDWRDRYDLVVGNPPYVRIEDLPKPVLGKYRSLYATTGDRADLYVAFLERGLQLLSPRGVLAFITANRFTKNLYGRKIRKLIAERYHVRHYVNLEHTQPFLTDVSAYPAIVIIDRERGKPTRATTLEDIQPATLRATCEATLSDTAVAGPVAEFADWYPDGGPWLTTSNREHSALHRLNGSLPTLEDSAPGTRAGIGVATGADRVFVLKGKSSEIEEDRQIPLLMASNISNREIAWSGRYLINPFDEDGGLVDLAAYRGLARYLEHHSTRLKQRHVAKIRPHAWYRTIDRIWPELQFRQKLVIPDIQGANSTTIGLDEGNYYPHHNVYWVASETWDLRALKTLLRSSLVVRQVRAYSVQMRGGSLRWQAQTLRKLRVPRLASLSRGVTRDLIDVSQSDKQEEIDAAAIAAYGG